MNPQQQQQQMQMQQMQRQKQMMMMKNKQRGMSGSTAGSMNGMNGMNNRNMSQSQMMMNNGKNQMMMKGQGGQVNRAFVNMNPALGGRQFSKSHGGLVFGKSANNAPDHRPGCYVMPWDSKNGDYVYAACPENVFKKKLSTQYLKTVNLTFIFIFFFGLEN